MRRLREIEVPRGAVAILCLLVVLPPAAMALGHSLWTSGGQWVHHHTKTYTFCNEIDQDTVLRDKAWLSREDWTQDTDLYLQSQSACHVSQGASVQSHIQLNDAHYGNTGWRASVINDSSTYANAAYHAEHTHGNFNLDTITSGYTGYDKQALACRTLGEIVGLAKVPSSEWSAHAPTSNDCMSFAGIPQNQTSAAENINNFTYSATPGTHSENLVNDTYGGHGPALDLSGPLADAAAESAILHEVTYLLNVTATGENHTPAKIESIEIRVDGQLELDHSCGSVVTCSIPSGWTFDPEQLALDVGAHEVEVRAIDVAGFTAAETLIGYVPDRSGAGNLDIATASEEAMAGDDELAVNVASGNALLTAPDVTAEDGMSAADLTRYYNSINPNESGAFGPGWRLGIGEDVRLTDGGHGSKVLREPSGVRTLFVSSGPCSFTTAPGTSAELTKLDSNGYELFVPESSSTMLFNSQGTLTGIESPTGPVSLTYSSGKLSSMSFEDGSTSIELSRTAGGLIESITRQGFSQPLAEYEYSNGRLIRHTDANGAITEYSYDQGGALETIERPGETTSEVAFDVDGRAEEVDPDIGTAGDTGYEYATGETTVSAPGETTEYAIDASGDVEGAFQGVLPPAVDVGATAPEEITEPVDPEEPLVIDVDTQDSSGVEWVGLVVDGDLVWETDQVCVSPPCTGPIEETIVYDPSVLLAGDYAAQVVVEDAQGNVSEENLLFRAPEDGACAGGEDAEEWSPPTTHTPTAGEVQRAQEFRARNGLPSSSQAVTASFADPDAVDAEMRYDVPLSDSEEEELSFRDNQLADAMTEVEEYGAAETGYAGAYIDQAAGGRVVVGFTTNVAVHEQELETLFSYPERLDVVQLPHSEAELNDLADDIAGDEASLNAAGIRVELMFVDPRWNVLDVTVAPRTASGPDADLLSLADATSLLEAEYGQGLRVANGALGPDDKKQRFKAGRKITNTADEPCAAGFGFSRSAGPHGNRTKYGMLTAAHCIDFGGQNWYYRTVSASNFIGDAVEADEAAIDVGKIRAAPRRAPRMVYLQNGRYAPVTKVKDHDHVGEHWCMSSHVGEDKVCGELINKRLPGGDDGSEKMRLVDTCKDYVGAGALCHDDAYDNAHGTDSGAPWFNIVRKRSGNTVTAIGIHEGRIDGRPWLHQVEFVGVIESHFNLKILQKR